MCYLPIQQECKSKVTHSIESEPTCSDLCGAVSLDSEGQPPGKSKDFKMN